MQSYKILKNLLFFFLTFSCVSCNSISNHGKCYQQTKNATCLQNVVELMPMGSDTSFVKQILGDPISFGFDFRYLVGISNADGCPMGAVFHIDENGKIDQKWYDGICE